MLCERYVGTRSSLSVRTSLELKLCVLRRNCEGKVVKRAYKSYEFRSIAHFRPLLLSHDQIHNVTIFIHDIFSFHVIKTCKGYSFREAAVHPISSSLFIYVSNKYWWSQDDQYLVWILFILVQKEHRLKPIRGHWRWLWVHCYHIVLIHINLGLFKLYGLR